MNNLNELFEIHSKDESKLRFQKKLADFVIESNAKITVETGSGLSSLFILKAIDGMGDRKLYSIDPEPFCEYEIEHPQYELIKKKSVDAMANLYLMVGEFDIILTDGDHDILHQTYEYEMSYGCIKNGGWIVADDYEWNAHFAWRDFLIAHGLEQVHIGDVMMTQKKENFIPSNIMEYSKMCLNKAIDANERWLACGNKNTFEIVYPDRTYEKYTK
jgi:hypothetical protein